MSLLTLFTFLKFLQNDPNKNVQVELNMFLTKLYLLTSMNTDLTAIYVPTFGELKLKPLSSLVKGNKDTQFIDLKGILFVFSHLSPLTAINQKLELS